MPLQPYYITETQILRRIARDPKCRFLWTKHALIEIEKDKRTTLDVERMLTNCQVSLIETNKKDILWRATGTDVDGNKLEAVVAVFEEEITIKIVTSF